MESISPSPMQPVISTQTVSRRSFLKRGLWTAAGLGLYSTEIERHWVEVTHPFIYLPDLPQAFDGMRVVQVGDIHLSPFTESIYVEHVVGLINKMQPDLVLLTGDYVTAQIFSIKHNIAAAWKCAEILRGIECTERYAVLGNHDVAVGTQDVTEALERHGIPVLNNGYTAIERGNSRIWLTGFADPLTDVVDLRSAVPTNIRNRPDEPVIAMCHAPDYADVLLADPAGSAVNLMLSGHTHGGQIRIPFVAPLALPPMGKIYVEGFFRVGNMQLYVNRGIGTVNLPVRFNCPPELTLHTLKRG
jgi:uncharacterized protein